MISSYLRSLFYHKLIILIKCCVDFSDGHSVNSYYLSNSLSSVEALAFEETLKCKHFFYDCSIGSPVFCYGVASPWKNLPINCLEIRMITEKEGKCQYIMVLTSSIISPSLQLSRKNLFSKHKIDSNHTHGGWQMTIHYSSNKLNSRAHTLTNYPLLILFVSRARSFHRQQAWLMRERKLV